MKLNKTTMNTMIATALLGFMGAASAQGVPASYDGYLIDSSTRAVKDSSGQCVRTSSWTPSSWHPDCNAPIMPRPAVVEAPVMPVPVQPVPQPTQPTAQSNLAQTVNFDFDSSRISEGEAQKLVGLVRDMQSMGASYTVIIDGHTDPVGSDSYNMALSKRRADSVAQFMRSQGLDVSGYSLNARGETELKVNCPAGKGMRECNRENRRVEIRVNR